MPEPNAVFTVLKPQPSKFLKDGISQIVQDPTTRASAEEARRQQEQKHRAEAEEARRQQEQKRRAEAEEARRQQEQKEQKRRADYNGFMAKGREHAAAKRYAEAIRAYNDALNLMPGDSAANTAIQDAKKAKVQEAPKNITNSIGMKLVLIPAGKFMMG